jgi:hypothetical protein
MNIDPTRPGGQSPDEEPVMIGAGLRPVEDRLRRALDADARSITPTDRLGAIHTEAHAMESRTTRPNRWLAPVAAAAAVVVVAGAVWALSRPPASSPPVAGTPAVSTSQESTGTPTTGPSSVPTQTATGPTTSIAPPATAQALVPVYYLGPVVSGSAELRLFREFVSTAVPTPETAEGKALAALRLAMGEAPQDSRYRSAWAGVTPESLTVGSDVITVRLSAGTDDDAALATEQLVWTVQAALGKSLPVRFELADGGADVSPGHPASAAYNRPSNPIDVLGQVSAIWVDEPARNGDVKAGAPLTVKGIASTFEANVEWELLRDGKSFEKGSTTAKEAAPARARYTFTTTKDLSAGTYVLRVFASSPKDGSVAVEQVLTITAG